VHWTVGVYAENARYRRQSNNRSLLVFEHDRKGFLHAVEGSVQVDAKQLMPLVYVYFVNRFWERHDPGIIYKDIQLAKVIRKLRKRGFHLIVLGHVKFHRDRLMPILFFQIGTSFRPAFHADIHAYNIGSVLGENFANSRPKPLPPPVTAATFPSRLKILSLETISAHPSYKYFLNAFDVPAIRR
jgi:hypothetical protein